jgi:hypothetical protein
MPWLPESQILILIFDFWICLFCYLKRLYVEFSSNLSLVWMKIKIIKIPSAILYEKITRSRISQNKALSKEKTKEFVVWS